MDGNMYFIRLYPRFDNTKQEDLDDKDKLMGSKHKYHLNKSAREYDLSLTNLPLGIVNDAPLRGMHSE